MTSGFPYAGYDEEARYFEAGVRRAKREELVARARDLVRGAFDAQLRHLRAALHDRAALEIAACAGREGGFAAAASLCAGFTEVPASTNVCL